jgi:hypothetical protein
MIKAAVMTAAWVACNAVSALCAWELQSCCH